MNLLPYHYISVFQENIKKYASKKALIGKIEQNWEGITWAEFGETTELLSKSMLSLGIKPQETIGIFSQNMPQWTLTDIAALQIRAIPVPIYATNTAEQALYVLNHAEIKILFVGDQTQYDKAVEVASQCPSLQKIVAFKDTIQFKENQYSVYWNDFLQTGKSDTYTNELQKRISNKKLNDLFTIIYTSGTTGEPKGVMLDYQNLAYQLIGHDIRLEVSEKDDSLAFLPLSHVFERAWTYYTLYKGATVYYLENTNEIKNALLEVKPTVMCAVPRFYEKIFATVHDRVATSSLGKRMVFAFAVRVGRKMLQIKQKHKKPSWLLKKSYVLSEKLVFSKLKQSLGGRIRFMPCGGANLEPSIGRFFHSIGINVKLGYGMTETLATVSCWDDQDFNMQSVGMVMPNAEIKIGADNEILIKGGMVMKGYYKKPEETKKVFTEDGFLRSGDAGNLDSENNVFITDRIKELMKTSNGKYIAPQHIEGKVGKYNLIEQIAIIADGKKFVSALIVPNFEMLTQALEELNIKYKSTTELLKNSQVIEYITKQLQKFQNDLPDYEKIKKFTLLPTAFSIERNEITPTLKLKRKVIYANYSKEIEAMYR
ncbi:long-chain fatty acid--CoA ligase [Capnocytophaga sp.]|uniref:AMP-dependent synthetase/ligase n=1 Tax=Capnocytophaga sp. TaxID=44737 RepID=UPI0026DCB892|nr:long-chain fatty acid--CoA ligase [Capnocytophaga sp.]MDO5106304.1 long-chain fatty acid--CoA ligase [Capnocytophaga sp.]